MNINQTKNISYKVLGLVSLFISNYSIPIFLESAKKIKLQELAVKTMIELKNMIYVLSKVPQKTLLLDVQEAREIIKAYPKSVFTPTVKPIIEPLFHMIKFESRKIEASLYEINENSESLEYSPIQGIGDITNFPFTNNERYCSTRELSLSINCKINSEEITKRINAFDCNDQFLEYMHPKTPTHFPRQSHYSISDIKKIMYNGNESTPDITEKPTLITEQAIRQDNKAICSCDYCILY